MEREEEGVQYNIGDLVRLRGPRDYDDDVKLYKPEKYPLYKAYEEIKPIIQRVGWIRKVMKPGDTKWRWGGYVVQFADGSFHYYQHCDLVWLSGDGSKRGNR